MPITATKLTGVAGLAAAGAGLLFILIQLIHPHEEVTTVTTAAWTVTALPTMAMSVLLLVGLTGIYLRQGWETGVLGLVGVLLLGASFGLTIAVIFVVEVFVLPPLADRAPVYVDGFLATFTGGVVAGDFGPLPVAALVTSVGDLLGGLLLGVAPFRARILARWAGLLLAVGSVATVLVPVVPDALDRPLAFSVGLARPWPASGTPLARATHHLRGVRGPRHPLSRPGRAPPVPAAGPPVHKVG